VAVPVAEAVAGADSKEGTEGGEPDFSGGAAQWWDRVADAEPSVRAGKDSERFMKYLARMDESGDTDAAREKMLKYLDRMDRVESIKHADENGSSTEGGSAERWRPITLDWTEAQEEKAESERERMMRYLDRIERNMWLEGNGTREGRVKDFFRMDEADPKQHLFNDTMAHKGKLETVKARREISLHAPVVVWRWGLRAGGLNGAGGTGGTGERRGRAEGRLGQCHPTARGLARQRVHPLQAARGALTGAACARICRIEHRTHGAVGGSP